MASTDDVLHAMGMDDSALYGLTKANSLRHILCSGLNSCAGNTGGQQWVGKNDSRYARRYCRAEQKVRRLAPTAEFALFRIRQQLLTPAAPRLQDSEQREKITQERIAKLEAERAQGGIPSEIKSQLENFGAMAAAQTEHAQRLKDHDITLRSVSEKIREAADQRDEQVICLEASGWLSL